MTLKKITGLEYNQWLSDLKDKIRNSQLRATLKVNSEMLQLYWELGKAIDEKIKHSDWGDKIITQLAIDLKSEFRGQGFSPSNLKYMRKWYQFYAQIGQQLVDQLSGLGQSSTENGQQAVDQFAQQSESQLPQLLSLIPWGHHIQIFTKCQTTEEVLYYLQQTTSNNWPRSVLVYHIESRHFHRKGKSHNNFKHVLPRPQSELAQELIKNPYNIEYLNLSGEISEKDLEDAILKNITKFLLELGIGFALCDRQFHIKVGDQDFYIDLLFYHARIHCYFVIELKVTDFEPEHTGKLEFYINAIDEQFKTERDNPTIGLLLCKTADKVVVQYSLQTKSKPMAVAEFKHSIPKEWKNELPDEKSLTEALKKEIIIPRKPVEQKIDRLKEIIKQLKTEPADWEKDNNLIKKVFNEILCPLFEKVNKKISDIKPMFKNYIVEGLYNQRITQWNMNDSELDASLLLEGDIWKLGFMFNLQTFLQGGIKAFNVWQRLEIYLDKHKYIIGQERAVVWQERVYRKFPTADELEEIADRFVEVILDEISNKAELLLSQ